MSMISHKNGRKIKIFAHRGFSARYPENTLLAFEKAVEAGCDGIELDVRMLKTGELVIMHDSEVSRVTDGQGVVEESSAADIRKLNVTGAFGARHGRNPIPFLEEYLDRAGGWNIITNIEIKRRGPGLRELEEKLISMLRRFHLSDRVILSSFDHTSVARCVRMEPSLQGAFLLSDTVIDPGKYAKRHGISWIHPRYSILDEEMALSVKSNGIQLNPYTVDRDEDIMRMLQLGVESIITNVPDHAMRFLADNADTHI